MADKPEANFDWVTARRQCSGPIMLEALREQVKANVARWNELATKERFKFRETEEIGKYAFAVFDITGSARRASDFSWDGEAINIALHTGENLRVTFGLNDEGQCKFIIGKEVGLDPWQVARRALEGLMF